MFNRLSALLVLFFLIPMLATAPSGQVIMNRAKPVLRPFFNMYTRLNDFVQSDATHEKAQKAWEIAQKVAVVTVIANILLPKCMKRGLGRMPVVGNFIFNGPLYFSNVPIAPKSPHLP
jgi:hypothetical protein